MSYPVVNPKPPFMPYDIVRKKVNGNLAVIKEVDLNTGQNKDKHQWSFSVYNLSNDTKVAWFNMDELEYVDNIFEIITDNSIDVQSTSDFNSKLFRNTRR